MVETYNGYQSFLMVTSPRWNAGATNDGGYVAFSMDETTTAQVNGIEWVGVMNFMPSDGTGTLLQPAVATGPILYRWEGVSVTPSYTSFSDTDGHGEVQYVDASGRPTERRSYSGSQWLSTTEGWDANNQLISSTDARGNESDYAYDMHGNTVAAAEPPPVSGGSRPTRLFSYDANDNVVAYCDPNATQSLGLSWTSTPTTPVPGQGGLCPQTTIATRYQWTTTAAEPFGELLAAISPATAAAPTGYQRTYSYDLAPQGGVDYGLPTRVSGAPMTQSDPATPTRQPQQSYWYDANRNLVCYGTGSGQWLLTYDALGRLTSAADPDDSASGSGACGKTGAQPGWNTTSRTSYFPNGAVASKQSPSQVANNVATAFTYDVDGNVTAETHRYGCTSTVSCTVGVTTKWYDGADRLVEVQLPYDASDVQQYPWSTRYIYDLNQGGMAAYRGMGLRGYGNLVSTQELLSGTVWTPVAGQTYSISTGTWTDVRATSYDALDRPISSYEAAFGDQPKATNGYDGPGAAGLLSSVQLATGELKTVVYDGLGRRTDVRYPNDPSGTVTPAIHESFDAAGHVTSRTTSVLGTETIGYDATGAVTSVVEPAALGGGTISYRYYADGLRSGAGYADANQSYPNAMQYGYRTDGKRDRLLLGNGTSFNSTYTAAGRLISQSDPLTGTIVHPTAIYKSETANQPYYPNSVTYAPLTQTFDQFGRLNTITYPVSILSLTAAQYDLDDGLVGHTASAYRTTPFPTSFTYCFPSTIRNAKVPTLPPDNNPCPPPSPVPQEINGAQLFIAGVRRNVGTTNWTLDARSGMLLHLTASLFGDPEGWSFTYDASGRLTQSFEGASGTTDFIPSWCPRTQLGKAAYRCYTSGSRQKTYDAENRLRSEAFESGATTPTGDRPYTTTTYGLARYGAYWEDTSGYNQPATIQVDYGTTSHPLRFSLYHPTEDGIAAHNEMRAWLWDGGDRFIECTLTNSQCQRPTLSMEGLGDYDLSSGTVIRINDRNRNGAVAISRDTTGFSKWKDGASRPRGIVSSPLAPCSIDGGDDIPTYNGANICSAQHDGKLTADGWSLDYETWQGVRTSDLTIGQWNTPDAYAGEVHDPMSQKPYVWNRNNPYEYSDPSGYDPEDLRLGFNGAIFVTPTSTRDLNKEGLPFNQAAARNGAEHGRIIGGSVVAVGTMGIKTTGPIGFAATAFGGTVVQASAESVGSKAGYLLGGYLGAPPVPDAERTGYDVLNYVSSAVTLRGLPAAGKGILAKGAVKANEALSKAAGTSVVIK